MQSQEHDSKRMVKVRREQESASDIIKGADHSSGFAILRGCVRTRESES